jgi:hypothetical protein
MFQQKGQKCLAQMNLADPKWNLRWRAERKSFCYLLGRAKPQASSSNQRPPPAQAR